ncbi:hypothetical protein FJT64_004661 [Amphibalanus amphitrite]|uniref:Uncharacterized protein n=1 Tax=Amphibalanus amphitrite TaxID=1232801 RepID=A0A6A4W7U6_AMPAM|nr:hypothetical protein FJT64_004661 [Amphibalanus amphitrite]
MECGWRLPEPAPESRRSGVAHFWEACCQKPGQPAVGAHSPRATPPGAWCCRDAASHCTAAPAADCTAAAAAALWSDGLSAISDALCGDLPPTALSGHWDSGVWRDDTTGDATAWREPPRASSASCEATDAVWSDSGVCCSPEPLRVPGPSPPAALGWHGRCMAEQGPPRVLTACLDSAAAGYGSPTLVRSQSAQPAELGSPLPDRSPRSVRSLPNLCGGPAGLGSPGSEWGSPAPVATDADAADDGDEDGDSPRVMVPPGGSIVRDIPLSSTPAGALTSADIMTPADTLRHLMTLSDMSSTYADTLRHSLTLAEC